MGHFHLQVPCEPDKASYVTSILINHIAVNAAIDHPKGACCILDLDGVEKRRQSYIIKLFYNFLRQT